MRYLTSDYILNNISQIEGWEPSVDSMSGALSFTNGTEDVVVYATPDWVEEGEVPIAVSVSLGELETYKHLGTLVFHENSSLEEQLFHYTNSVRGGINVINSLIKR